MSPALSFVFSIPLLGRDMTPLLLPIFMIFLGLKSGFAIGLDFKKMDINIFSKKSRHKPYIFPYLFISVGMESLMKGL